MNSQQYIQQLLLKQAKIKVARVNFWQYCKALAPDFYTEQRPHLKQICEGLQALYEGRIVKYNKEDPWQIIPFEKKPKPGAIICKKFMMNIPPQHGKTRTLVNFSSWVFGTNNKEKIIVGSYNDSTAGDFSRYTRDAIDQKRNFDNDLIYADIFPDTRIKKGNASFEKWALEGSHFSYMGAGVGGSLTSKGASILVIDDPIKGAEEALNTNNLDKVWLWYTSTFSSRVAAVRGEPIEIMNMTRWSKLDPCGRILELQENNKTNDWYVLTLPAFNEETKQMLCDDLFSYKRYCDIKLTMEETIFTANYKQETMEATGLLFYAKDLNFFKKADIEKQKPESVIAYCDVADAGEDYLSMPFAKVFKKKIFITDALFTKENTDITIPLAAGMIKTINPVYVRVESNAAGRIFASNLGKLVGQEKILTVNNTTSKHSRIMNMYGFIKMYCHFLDKSEYEPGSDYDKFMRMLLNYMRNGKSKQDDAPDSLAGLTFFIQSWLPNLFE